MPLLVLAVGFAVSAGAAVAVSRTAAARDKARFEQLVGQTQDSLAARLETYVAMLRAGAGFVAAHDGVVTRAAFNRFAQALDLPGRYPGVQGIGYSVRLPLDDPHETQTELARLGAPGLQLYPPGRRDELHAIVDLEPSDRRNLAAIGYDMFSEPVRRAAMARARDSARPAASGRVQLVQEIDRRKQAGFLIYMPVYRGEGIPADVAARRAALAGFVYSPFRADDLMQGVLGSGAQPRLGLQVYDGEPSPETLLHRSASAADQPRLTTRRTLEVAGRSWTIVYATRPGFELSSSRDFAPYVFAAGAGASLLLALAAGLEARTRRRAERAALAERAHARELEVLQEVAARLAAELDRDRLMQAVTDAGRELSGAEIGAFFVHVSEAAQESYQLFSISGAPREAFAALGLPRKTGIFQPTFDGEAIVRADDITRDPRYGANAPHSGLPNGHWPVRSHLAVPVVARSGKVLGGLIFGHSRIGVFTAQSERSIVALAHHAAVAMENATLFQAAQAEIAARLKVEAHQKLLLDELNHRVKNTLATVQSIAVQSLRSPAGPSGFREIFEARLLALSEAHNLLSNEAWRGADLATLAARELAPYGGDDPTRIRLDGEPAWLSPSATVAFGMALHELAMNAARHGALSSPTGRVEVSWGWDRRTGGGLRFVWQESGGPPVRAPARRGFGLRMMERGLRQEFGGDVEIAFEPSGLRCVVFARSLANSEAA